MDSNETKMENYSFSYYNEDNVSTNLTFTVPAFGVTMETFVEMCRKFALACGYMETTVTKYLGEYTDGAFTEFME